MAERGDVSILNIVDGICAKLRDEFGDGYRIYTEAVRQGLEEPCFFINFFQPLNRSTLGKRYFTNIHAYGSRYYRENLFCIQYFAAGDEPKAECVVMQERLFFLLEYISVGGDLLRGSHMRGELENGVLSFFVNFNTFVIRLDGAEPMEELDHRSGWRFGLGDWE